MEKNELTCEFMTNAHNEQKTVKSLISKKICDIRLINIDLSPVKKELQKLPNIENSNVKIFESTKFRAQKKRKPK